MLAEAKPKWNKEDINYHSYSSGDRNEKGGVKDEKKVINKPTSL